MVCEKYEEKGGKTRNPKKWNKRIRGNPLTKTLIIQHKTMKHSAEISPAFYSKLTLTFPEKNMYQIKFIKFMY
jgi:hypothetical protein